MSYYRHMENINVGEKLLKELQEERKELKISAILTFITGIGLLTGVFFQFTEASVYYVWGAFLVAYLAGGFVATIDAIKNLWEKKLDINVLMILAALAAASVGEVRDGAILLFLFSLAGTLEGYAMGNTKRAVVALMQLRPDEANLLNSDNTTSRVAVEKLLIDQRVVVRPGERMPVDGVIESGLGAIDESSITGESVPVDKAPGDKVFAGSVNQNAVLVVKVTKLANQSTIARMIDLVTKAQEERSPSERFSDWFGERYTIVVLLGSFLALIIFLLMDMSQAEAFYKAATLLVVASPCAIVISVPAAILSALASAARTGVLFKGGAALEDFGVVKTIAFDKTGTLTEGKMEVTDVVGIYTSKEMVLEIANALETHSEHPLARSIQNYALSLKVAVKEARSVRAVPGKGIVAEIDGVSYWAGNRALLAELGVVVDEKVLVILEKLEQEGKTTILVGTEAKVMGAIGIADKIRESAVKALAMLKKQGVERFVMLTGDTKLVANAVGQKLGLAEADIYGALLPEDKVNLVKELREKNTIAFVGDGVNDAAALATSNVGVAMGVAGTDVAIEAADVALLSDDLERLAYTHSLSQKANQIIKQNLIFAVGIMAVMVVTTVFWYLPLPLGVIGHEGGTLLVVANGLRLLFMSK
jgi:Cd2+/Zn2+-exporting ATPase